MVASGFNTDKQRLHEDLTTYRKRQAIVEHPYGVIKRQWGFYYIMTKKTIQHASADVGLIFTAFDFFGMTNLHCQNRTQNVNEEAAILLRACIFGVGMRF